MAWAGRTQQWGVIAFLSNPVMLAHPGPEAHRSLFCPVSARGVAERTPSFMYPQGTSSSQMVLRGMDLLLECIASGVYVPPAPSSIPAPEGWVGINPHILEADRYIGKGKASRPMSRTLYVYHPHPTMAVSALGQWQFLRKKGNG